MSTALPKVKMCLYCRRIFPATSKYFYRRRAEKDGWNPKCKDCARLAGGHLPRKKARTDGKKRCNQCGKLFPATTEYFYRHKYGLLGLKSQCKNCISISSGYTPKPPPRTDGKKKCAWCGTEYPATTEYFYRNKLNRDGFHSYCKSCLSERDREYRERISDVLKKRKRRYRQANKEQIRKRNRRYIRENREKVSKRSHRYRKTNPGIIKACRYRRKARKLGLPDAFTSDDYRRMMRWWSNVCAYCGSQQSFWHPIEADHYIPLADDECPGTVPENMIPACKSCNTSKQNSAPDEWVISRFGKRKGRMILKRIGDYFEWVKAQNE